VLGKKIVSSSSAESSALMRVLLSAKPLSPTSRSIAISAPILR
jgi:hypothetical protein